MQPERQVHRYLSSLRSTSESSISATPSRWSGCGYAGAEKLSQPRKAILSRSLFAARACGARRQAAFPAHLLDLRPQDGELTDGRGVARRAPRGVAKLRS